MATDQEHQQHPDWDSEKLSNGHEKGDEEKDVGPPASDHDQTDVERQDSPAEKQPQPPTAAQQEGPPNGGTLAWLQVVGAWCLFFNTWGILNTFGIFQTYYESGQLYTASSSDISWIGSIQAFLVLLVGAFIGPIYDRGYFRTLLLVGSFMIVFGFMMLSLCTTFWQCLLAQGFVIGIGGESRSFDTS